MRLADGELFERRLDLHEHLPGGRGQPVWVNTCVTVAVVTCRGGIFRPGVKALVRILSG